MSKKTISFDEFLDIEKKLEIKIGTIKSVTNVAKSTKLLEMTVSFGDDDVRPVVTNIGDRVDDPQGLVGIQIPFITNLAPAKIMGVQSEAMIMVGETTEGVLQLDMFTDGTKLL